MDDFSSTERIEDTRTEGERELDRANLNMKGMRSSLSMLTAASAQLATALEKRNQEYDTLLARQDEFNRRLEAVQTELNLASAEASNFKEQVNERNAHLIEIQGRLDHLQAELEAVAASKAALETQLAEVQDELERRTAELDGLTASPDGDGGPAREHGGRAGCERRATAGEPGATGGPGRPAYSLGG